MVYGIALCTYSDDGLYRWSLLDGRDFQSHEEAIEYARQYTEDRNWNGIVTFSDEENWNWRREDNDGEMDDLCLVCANSNAGLVQVIRHFG